MALIRYTYGDTAADYVVAAGDASGTGKIALLRGGVSVTFWDADTGGTQHTQLQDAAGLAVTSITTVNTGGDYGYLPMFYGPAGVRKMWADANGGTGPRSVIHPTNTGVYVDGDQTILGPYTLTDVLTILQKGLATNALVIDQNNTVTSTSDAEMVKVRYKGNNAFLLQEKGMPRVRRVDNEVVGKIFARGNDTAANTAVDIWQWFRDNGGVDTLCARMGAAGGLFHALNDCSLWSSINVDSPTVLGKFTAHAQDTFGGVPRAQVITLGGNPHGYLSGRVAVVGDATSNAQIASGLPTGLTYRGMGGTVSTHPARRRFVVAGTGGAGGQRVQINADGSMQIVGTMSSNTELYLDGLLYPLD